MREFENIVSANNENMDVCDSSETNTELVTSLNKIEMSDRETLIEKLKATYKPMTNRTRGAIKRKHTWEIDDEIDEDSIECEERS